MAFKQLDLFVASAVDISPKAQQELMQRCWFSLNTNLRTTPIKHEYIDADGEKSWVEIIVICGKDFYVSKLPTF